MKNDELRHFGILGMKWGVRRFQNEDGTLTEEGKRRKGKDTKPASSKKEQPHENSSRKKRAYTDDEIEKLSNDYRRKANYYKNMTDYLENKKRYESVNLDSDKKVSKVGTFVEKHLSKPFGEGVAKGVSTAGTLLAFAIARGLINMASEKIVKQDTAFGRGFYKADAKPKPGNKDNK